MTTVRTAYQGIEVKDIDHEVKCRHPQFGYDPDRMYVLAGASLLALADGTFVVVCDECDFNGITGNKPYTTPVGEYRNETKQADSLVAHINGMHHPNKPNRNTALYSDDLLKVAIKVWLKWKGTGIKNWTQSAADELNRLGFKPVTSEEWTSGQLGGLVREYLKKDRFKNIKPASAGDDNVKTTPKQQALPKDDETVNMDPVRKPTLSFAVDTEKKPPNPTRNVMLDVVKVPAPREAQTEVAVQTPVQSDFALVSVLDGGIILFTYKGKLMGGKPVKGVEI